MDRCSKKMEYSLACWAPRYKQTMKRPLTIVVSIKNHNWTYTQHSYLEGPRLWDVGAGGKKNMQLLATFDMNIIVANAPMNINQHKWWVESQLQSLVDLSCVFFFQRSKMFVLNNLPYHAVFGKEKHNHTIFTVYLYHTKCFRGSMLRDGLYLWVQPTTSSSDSTEEAFRSSQIYPAKSLALSSWITFSLKHIYNHLYLSG